MPSVRFLSKELELLTQTAEKAHQAMDRRFGDDTRWDAVTDTERQRLVAEAVEEVRRETERQRDEAKVQFRALVQRSLELWRKEMKAEKKEEKREEKRDEKRDERREERRDDRRDREDRREERREDRRDERREEKREDAPPFSKMRERLEEDPSWSKLSSTERENIYYRVVRELDEARRKQVAKQRGIQMEAEEARKKRKLSEVEEKVFSVLAERCKNPFSLTWDEAKDELGDLLDGFSLRDGELEPLFLDYQKRSIEARREVGKRLRRSEWCQAWLCILDNAGFDAIGPELDFEDRAHILDIFSILQYSLHFLAFLSPGGCGESL